jgi:adenylate cyclase
MTRPIEKNSFLSGVGRYRFKTIVSIAIFWTIIDLVMMLLSDIVHREDAMKSIVMREVLVLLMSFVMGYLFIYGFKKVLQQYPLWVNFLSKSILLLLAAFIMNFIVHFVQNIILYDHTAGNAVNVFLSNSLNAQWLLQKTIYWLILFFVTQLFIEINEKYSPGVFRDILLGKYIKPREENRIVMFIDLKDSTPIAEKLGHHQYFLFIREFIRLVSMALIDHNGRIYQYVGDEVVVSWSTSKKNIKECLASIIDARKYIQKNSERFRRKFSIVPEFRIGIHVGEVTVGEIGIIKKDLAMSGDTMNTTARIRSACNELNQKFIVSADFVQYSDLKDFQCESLGIVDLKGKTAGIELFSLKI